MPATFVAQGFDIGDPWQMYDADGHNCSHPGGSVGEGCVVPWTDLAAWDPLMAALAPAIRADTTPSFMGGIHPRAWVGGSFSARERCDVYADVGGVSGPSWAGGGCI